MKTKSNTILLQNKAFLLVALITAFILSLPALAMVFHIRLLDPGSGMEELNWSLFDFGAMGVLLFSTGSIFVIAARIFRKTSHRIAIGIVLLFAFLYIWAELAVGIFTN